MELQSDMHTKTAALPEVEIRDGDDNKAGSKKPPKVFMVGVFEIFKFANRLDRAKICLAILLNVVIGSAFPISTVILGRSSTNIGKFQNMRALLHTKYPTLQIPDGLAPNQIINFTQSQVSGFRLPPEFDIVSNMTLIAQYFALLSLCMITCMFLQMHMLVSAAQTQIFRIRLTCFRRILSQEQAWFDQQSSGALTTELNDNISKIYNGIGDKLGLFFQWTSCFLFCVGVSLAYNWKLTLVLLAISPIVSAVNFFFIKSMGKFEAAALESYSQAGAIAEEVLSSVRTVFAFGGQSRDLARYSASLSRACRAGQIKGVITGAMMGSFWLFVYCNYAFGFWYGGKLIHEQLLRAAASNFSSVAEDETAASSASSAYFAGHDVGNFLTVFFCVITAASALGTAMPNLNEFNSARTAAKHVFAIIARNSAIDSFPPSSSGRSISLPTHSKTTTTKPAASDKLHEAIELNNVCFAYPTRPDVPVLLDFSLRIPHGKVVALVGASGSGKSSVVKLLQRMYDPDTGTISVDGVPLKELNIKWWRNQVGVVSQEPILFDCSIRENINLDLLLPANSSEKQQINLELHSNDVEEKQRRVEQVCHMANAWKFISHFPAQLDTQVGDRGAQLSGGQKQRIAIARAVYRTPRLLILDEATSALDVHSERVVQAALYKAARGLAGSAGTTKKIEEGREKAGESGITTVIVAHRLSTIKRAHMIVCMEAGRVVEQGTHEELMARGEDGLYHRLVAGQLMEEAEKEEVTKRKKRGDTAAQFEEEEDDVDDENDDEDEEEQEEEEVKEQEKRESSSLLATPPSSPLDGGLAKLTKSMDSPRAQIAPAESSSSTPARTLSQSKPLHLQMHWRRKIPKNNKMHATHDEHEEHDAPMLQQTKQDDKSQQQQKEKLEMKIKDGSSNKGGVMRLMKLNKPEWPLMLVGVLGALINGSVMPAYAIVFAKSLTAINMLDADSQEPLVNLYAIMFAVLGITGFLGCLVQDSLFAKTGELLTMRCRKLIFKTMLKQEIGWFDRSENNIGALMNILGADASKIHGATGVRIGTIIYAGCSLGFSLVIAFVYQWKMSFAIIVFTPLLFIAGAVEMKMNTGFANKESTHLVKANKIAIEVIENVLTVKSLSAEANFAAVYAHELYALNARNSRRTLARALVGGITQGVFFWAQSAAFFVAGHLMWAGEADMTAVFCVFAAIVLSGVGIGNAISMAPNAGEAVAASQSMFRLLARNPGNRLELEARKPDASWHLAAAGERRREGAEDSQQHQQLEVELQDVHFAYPGEGRRGVPVLHGMSVCAAPCRVLALVGASGCGKSTVVQLLQRFYEPDSGRVTVAQRDIGEFGAESVRRCMALVSQEPTLFSGTIRANIEYGDNARAARDGQEEAAARKGGEQVGETATAGAKVGGIPFEEVVAAAELANIHAFIMSLPNGYETQVGERGAQLSGGQKQRIAIARALIRRPRLLLLDEATSALDSESERVVQAALDNAQHGRTCVVIAHRLSTVQNAHRICVMQHGRVVEQGTHAELMQLTATATAGGDGNGDGEDRGSVGIYRAMVEMQQQEHQQQVEPKAAPANQ